MKSGKCRTHEDTLTAHWQYLETKGFTVASHSNKRVGVLPCFLLVKSSVTVVSQFTLFLGLPEHRHWKRLGPQLGRTVCGLAMGQKGHVWLPCRTGHGPGAGQGDEGDPGSSNLQRVLGLGRDWGSKPVLWQLPSPLLQLCKTGSLASGFSLDSLLKWKKGDLWHLDVSKCPFFHFK